MDRVTEKPPVTPDLTTEIAEREVATRTTPLEPVFELERVQVCYGSNPAVAGVSFPLYKNEITAFIGPSGCGKSTLIRCLNRMNDLIPTASISGRVLYHGVDLYRSEEHTSELQS